MTVETELKFSIPAASAAHVARLAPVRAAVHGPAISKSMRSIYYDTPDFDLGRERVSLRLRRENGAWIQTLKTPALLASGLTQREETDSVVPGQMLDHAALVESAASEVFTDARRLASLKPVFEAEYRRTVRELTLATGSRVELAVDVGCVRAGERSAPFAEVELELESGSAVELVDFALALLDHAELRLEPLSKAERGYALARGAHQRPAAGRAPELIADMAVGEAFVRALSAFTRDLLVNGNGMLASDDVEHLHQARIAIRRQRLALRAFEDVIDTRHFAAPLATLEWLGAEFATARDWDVFVLETLPALARDLGDDGPLARLRGWAENERDRANRQARDAVASKRYTRMALEMTAAMLRAAPVTAPPQAECADRRSTLDQAREALATRHKNLVRRGDAFADLDTAGLHALRKEIKKVRYLAELFAPLWPRKKTKAYVGALRDLQDLLGAVNDSVVVERLVAQWRQIDLAAVDHETIGLVRGLALARMREHVEQLPRAWRVFRDAAKFWR